MADHILSLVETDVLRHAIRAAGLKVTQPRIAVLAALQRHPHSSAEKIFTEVQKELASSSTQAVYGILAAFTGAGLARRFDPPGTPALFEQRVGDNHHHLVCVHCGEIQDVDCVIGEAPCLTPAEDYGFSILSAEVTFTGLCHDCATATGPTPTPAPVPVT
jgi:Fur family ferric uptake transcriptional regulator